MTLGGRRVAVGAAAARTADGDAAVALTTYFDFRSFIGWRRPMRSGPG